MERSLRSLYREAVMLAAAGDDDALSPLAQRISAVKGRLEAHCDENELTYRRDRVEVYGYDKDVMQRVNRLITGFYRDESD